MMHIVVIDLCSDIMHIVVIDLCSDHSYVMHIVGIDLCSDIMHIVVIVLCSDHSYVMHSLVIVILHHFSGYSKTRYKKLFTHVKSHASAVSLLESGE